MTRLKLALAFALTLGAGVAFAQVPPTGSGTNGWLQSIFNQLSDSGGAGPATPITATFSGADTTTAAATLAAAASKTTFICGFQVNGLGATGLANGVATVTGLTGGATINYTYSMPAGVTVVTTTPLNVIFSPCIPGNAVNTAIVVTVPGAAGNTSTTISAQGYQR